MASQANILMVEGSFEDQILEMAQYLDTQKRVNPAQGITVEIEKFVQEERKDEALDKIVSCSSVLATAPEREFIPAYNLLIHLIRSSSNFNKHLPTLLQHLSTPPQTAPHNGPTILISVLSTLYNVLPVSSHERYPVYKATLNVVAKNGLYDLLIPQLEKVDKWVEEWGTSEAEKRDLFVTIAGIAEEAGDDDQFYNFLLKALKTFPDSEAGSAAARDISVRLVKAAINIPSRLDFDELAITPGVIALESSEPQLFQLFEVFAGGQLEDYVDFNDENDTWAEDNGINTDAAYRKIRLLTLTSLAASCADRSLPYNTISRRLHVPEEDVELWVIDVIRAGLVEGKLSQLNQTFLIHRANVRNFGEEEWKQVADRLSTWKDTLRGILEVVKNGREQAKAQEARDQQRIEGELAGLEIREPRERRGGRDRKQQHQERQKQQEVEVEG